MIERSISQLAEEGVTVSTSIVCVLLEYPRRSFYDKEKHRQPGLNEILAGGIRRVIDALSYGGYRTAAWLLGENNNTVQQIFPFKGWQARKRKSDHLPRVLSLPFVATRPNERWVTDMARIRHGELHRWCALTLVIDCYTRELPGWRLSPMGNAKAAKAALDEALIRW